MNENLQNNVEQQLPTFDETIKKELKKFDEVVPAIEELKKEFLPLKIVSIEDKEGYNLVSKSLRFVISKRTAIEDKRKELKADSLAFGRAVDAKAKEITEMLSPIEEHLKSEKAKIDAEIEAIKKKVEELKLQKIKDRHNLLISSGMNLIANEYVWQSKFNPEKIETLLSINLELLSDEDFDFTINSVKKLLDEEYVLIEQEKEKERIEQIRIAEENKKIAEEKEKLEAERKKMLQEMEEIRKSKEEFVKNRTINRNGWLMQLGLSTLSFSDHFVFIKESDNKPIPIITFKDVQELEDTGWEIRFNNIKQQIEEFKKEDEVEIKKIEEKKIKEAEIIAAELEKAKALKLQQEALEEAERIAAMSDKEKFDVYVKKLLEIAPPELKTKRWTSSCKAIKDTLNTFLNMK